MNIKLLLSVLMLFGIMSGCSDNNSIETADTSVTKEQISLEEGTEIDPNVEIVEVDNSEEDDGVVEGMGHDYNDPYYTDREVENQVGDAVEIEDGVVEGMGHDYNDPYYTDR